LHPALRFAVLTNLGTFLDEHRGVNIETVITNTAAAVVDEGLDIVLHIGRLTDSSLMARRIAWTRPIVCASEAYVATKGEPLEPDALAHHPAVIYARRDEPANTRWRFTRGNDTREVHVPVRTVSRDGVGVVDAALGGCGIARPFDIAARHLITSGALRQLLPDWTAERQPISIVLAARDRSTPARTRLFTDYIAELLT
jgi:DNA-binding transcriptional LysR family regulator